MTTEKELIIKIDYSSINDIELLLETFKNCNIQYKKIGIDEYSIIL